LPDERPPKVNASAGIVRPPKGRRFGYISPCRRLKKLSRTLTGRPTMAVIDVVLECQKCGTSLHPYYLTDKRRVFICPACHLLYLVVIEILPIQEKEAMG